MLARWRSHAERNVTTTGSVSIDCICCAKRLMTSSADSRKGDYEQSFSSFKAAVNQTDKTVQLPRSYLGGYMAYICPGIPRSTWLTISYPPQLIPSHPFPIHYSDQPCHIHHSSIYSTCHVSRPVETNLYPCALFTVV